MLPVLEDPEVRARVPAFTVEQYHLLFEAGGLAKNVELIRGAIIEKMPKSPLHASIVTKLDRLVRKEMPPESHIRIEQPLTLHDSEPEPDFALVRGTEDDYTADHPETAEIVIEVAVSSERIDRIKIGIYAEACVREYWLVLALEKAVERYTRPEGSSFHEIVRAEAPDSLSSTVLPSLSLAPGTLCAVQTSTRHI